jgi:predicted RND superfamily exporter protein
MKNNIINISQLIIESEDASDEEFLNILKSFKKELVYTKQNCILNSKENTYYTNQLNDLKEI